MKQKITIISLLVLAVIGTMQSCKKEKGTENVEKNETKVSTNGDNNSHNTGQNCMSCHKQGGSGEGWFTVAGSVYDSLKTSAYPNSTVKLYTGPNGTGTLKYTIPADGLGNFYTTASIDFAGGLYPSIQGSLVTKYMSSTITTGQCNSCHGVSTDKLWTK